MQNTVLLPPNPARIAAEGTDHHVTNVLTSYLRSPILPPALARIAAEGTDHLVTNELASYLRCASQTIRKAYSLTGHYLGVRPLKLGNRLLWPINDVAQLLPRGAQ